MIDYQNYVGTPLDRDAQAAECRAEALRSARKRVEAARLIAAAPDLLAALEALVAEYVDYATLNNLGDPEKQHNIKIARAAIAKATGT